jgi:hypothetical protein
LATAEADAHSLVSAARDLIHVDDPQTAGLWPRAAALLGRQAIEAAMADLWQLSAPGLEDTSAKCQLLCLSHFLGDPDLAGRVHAAWHGLTQACHIQIYELAPTAGELEGWLEIAWDLAERVAAIRARKAAHDRVILDPPRLGSIS